MTSTEQKNVRGVSGDALKTSIEAVFSGWREWSKELGNLNNLKTTDKSNVVAAINEVDAQNNIRTYTSLEQMGLSDDNMSPDDFAANMNKITVANRTPFIAFLQIYNANADKSNFRKSLIKKLNDDGFAVSDTINFQLKIERASVYNTETIKLEVYFDTKQYREKTIIGCANREGTVMFIYPFRELAKIEKSATEIELLNGWEKYRDDFVISKIGDYVNLTFAIDKGTRENGTVVFVLPEKFRPKGIRSCPILASSQQVGAHTRVAFYPNGNAVLYGCDTSENYLVFAGGFTI